MEFLRVKEKGRNYFPTKHSSINYNTDPASDSYLEHGNEQMNKTQGICGNLLQYSLDLKTVEEKF